MSTPSVCVMCHGSGNNNITGVGVCPACAGTGQWLWRPDPKQAAQREPPLPVYMQEAVEEFRHLEDLAAQLNAPTPDACSCHSCVNACKRKPGWFLPGEAQKVADFLGTPLEELFKTKLAVDFFLSSPSDIYVLSPAIRHYEGEVFPYDPLGCCVFLVNDRCSIHEVKPFECRQLNHESDVKLRHEAVASAWKDKQDEVTALYPYPYTPDREDTWAY